MNDNEKSKYSDCVVENNSSELELFNKIDQIITKIIWINFSKDSLHSKAGSKGTSNCPGPHFSGNELVDLL
mgnify:CR=1 FL=1